jgi:polynucleotide 5'-kinase involved in rRNA processing
MRIKPSQSNNQRQEVEALEKELRDKALIFRPDVQRRLKTANSTYSQDIYDSAITRLHLILESHATECMRTSDPFRPYGPESLLSQGSLRLIDQMDEQEFRIDPNKLVTGMLVVGPQGSGKSRFIRHLCNELLRV